MATFNGEQYIEAQIISILKQLKSDDELIISDDSSLDGTVKVIKSIKDSRIVLLEGNLFRDPIKNFQNALGISKGKKIFLADQDDIWIDGKYSLMTGLLDKFDLVISDSIIVDQDLHQIHPSFFSYFNSGQGILKNILKSSYYGSCMAFNRKVLQAAIPFPDTKEIGHDLWLGLVGEMIGTVHFLKVPLLLYRRHSNAFTPEIVGKSIRKKSQMINGRIVMIREVVKFLLKHSVNERRSGFNNNPSI